MGKKSATPAVSKISSTASPAVLQPTNTSQKSSILKSAFAPSHLQLRLFASVIQSFETQQLRIHDTSSGRLRCQHAPRPGTKITSLDWGYYGTSVRENPSSSNKKRKRDHSHTGSAVLAYGTSNSEISMFSPAEGKVVGTLSGGHERGIKDFRFSKEVVSEGWSIGGDGKLVQWDLSKDKAIRSISLPDPSVNILASPTQTSPQILCASSTPFAIDFASSEEFRTESFDSFKSAIHTIFRSGTDPSHVQEHFLASDNNRYINIYDISQKLLVRTLVAGSEVEEADLYTPAAGTDNALSQQMLAVVTRDGVVELFFQPFLQPAQINGDLKSSRKSSTKKASASVRLVSSESKAQPVPIFSASLQGPELLVASATGGVDVAFQKIRWQDEETAELLFAGRKDVVHIKSASTLNTATMNGVKDLGKPHVDESKTVVVNGGGEIGSQEAAIEISSSEGEDDVDDEDEGQEDEDAAPSEGSLKAPAGVAEESNSDEEMDDVAEADVGQIQDATAEGDGEPEEPSFGEMLASKHPNAITIADSFQPETSVVAVTDGKLSLPPGMSLGTVLTQSLRTNDRNLLESCLHVTDIETVKNTIQRLDSSLAGILLSKLAERLASRPGRYGHLLTWVQWTCIAHGGAIAAQPSVTAKVKTLYGVLNQRCKSLDSLLVLKGKLDMLDAQLTFRKQLQAQRGLQRDGIDEPGMIYIEGEGDNWESDEDLDESAEAPAKSGKKPTKALAGLVADEESSADEDMPLANGIHSESDDEEEENEEEDVDAEEPNQQRSGGIVDDEAEEETNDEEEDDDEEGSSEEELTAEEEEDDSEMDDFINDDSISEVEDENDVDLLDDGDDTPKKPEKKKSKYR